MLVVISPAKRLDWSERQTVMTPPDFAAEANTLAGHARQLTLAQLKALMDLSPDLARLNRDRFRAFTPEPVPQNARPAALAFAGDTYAGLNATDWTGDDLDWAQVHLRILSGLYGFLRPLDAIQPYRLEMGSRLKTRRGATLYDYWGQTLSKTLNATAQQLDTDVLINCASQEYFGAVDRKALKLRIITPQFMEVRDGTARMVSFFAKKARGAMARHIVRNRLTDPADLRDFDTDGYRFDGDSSTPDRPVFARPYPSAAKAA